MQNDFPKEKHKMKLFQQISLIFFVRNQKHTLISLFKSIYF